MGGQQPQYGGLASLGDGSAMRHGKGKCEINFNIPIEYS